MSNVFQVTIVCLYRSCMADSRLKCAWVISNYSVCRIRRYIIPFLSRMLTEYHELYELQRHRLEEVVAQLSYDQELWQQAAYELSWKVAEEYDIQTLQRLQLCEKSWCKLAGHYSILLSGKDTRQVVPYSSLCYRHPFPFCENISIGA